MSERLDEVRRLVADRPVHAVEGDLFGARLDAGHVEHRLERPRRASARCPIAPLANWPPATRGLEKPRLLPEH